MIQAKRVARFQDGNGRRRNASGISNSAELTVFQATRRRAAPPIKTSSRSGKTPTPTSLSWKKPRPSTRS